MELTLANYRTLFILRTNRVLAIMRYSEQNKYPYIYLPIIGGVCFCFARKYSIVIVNTTVVRRRVVYIGTLTPRTDSIEASFLPKKKRTVNTSQNST
jgi:hypothetical protein